MANIYTTKEAVTFLSERTGKKWYDEKIKRAVRNNLITPVEEVGKPSAKEGFKKSYRFREDDLLALAELNKKSKNELKNDVLHAVVSKDDNDEIAMLKARINELETFLETTNEKSNGSEELELFLKAKELGEDARLVEAYVHETNALRATIEEYDETIHALTTELNTLKKNHQHQPALLLQHNQQIEQLNKTIADLEKKLATKPADQVAFKRLEKELNKTTKALVSEQRKNKRIEKKLEHANEFNEDLRRQLHDEIEKTAEQANEEVRKENDYLRERYENQNVELFQLRQIIRDLEKKR